MRVSQRRLVLTAGLLAVFAAGAYAYWLSLVPASHPDHDHGILNLDAGGRLLVKTRSGKDRNLVGRPGKVMVVSFFSTQAAGAARELGALLDLQAASPGTEFVYIAQDPDFATLDAWLASAGLKPVDPSSFVLDPSGETTHKLNSKRPLETMVFTPEGKLSSQGRGRVDLATEGAGMIRQASAGGTIE